MIVLHAVNCLIARNPKNRLGPSGDGGLGRKAEDLGVMDRRNLFLIYV